MLGAILCNLPYFSNSGSFHGFAPGRTGHGTGWNQNWSEEYGPDYEKARKAKIEDLQEAIETLSTAPYVPPQLGEAIELIDATPLATELMGGQEDVIVVMTAYFAFLRWREQDEEDAAILLLLM